jgi:hypothetical protein
MRILAIFSVGVTDNVYAQAYIYIYIYTFVSMQGYSVSLYKSFTVWGRIADCPSSYRMISIISQMNQVTPKKDKVTTL